VSDAATERFSSTWVLRAALLLLFARLLLHAAAIPVFEGPDEPFHLDRAVIVAHDSVLAAAKPVPLSPELQRAIARNPCAPDLRRAFGCPPFSGGSRAPGAPSGPLPVQSESPNYENNQPPLYYAVAGSLLAWSEKVLPPAPSRAPEDELIRLRILSVLFVIAAVAGPLRAMSRRRSSTYAVFGFAAMFLPGFAESLIRCSNDALLFLWVAVVIDAIDRGYRGAGLPLLLALGCLIKLNALPILAFGLVLLAIERRRKTAFVSAILALAPAIVLGGTTWGGAVKIARRIPRPMPAIEVVTGLARSVYTVAKGVLWMGEWSFFRPPIWVLLLGAAVLALLVGHTRIAPHPRRLPAHAAGVVVALGGTIAFLLADRRVFGDWGGVGGWYVWSWTPWLALLADDTLRWRGRIRLAILGVGAYLVAINVSWFSIAGRLYGYCPRAPSGDRRAEMSR
jgi:hypothetical protein